MPAGMNAHVSCYRRCPNAPRTYAVILINYGASTRLNAHLVRELDTCNTLVTYLAQIFVHSISTSVNAHAVIYWRISGTLKANSGVSRHDCVATRIDAFIRSVSFCTKAKYTKDKQTEQLISHCL